MVTCAGIKTAPAEAALGSGMAVHGRWTGVILLTLAYIMNFLDRQILAVLIEPIKAEMLLSDTQVGLLTGTLFAVFYSCITLPVAMLADRANRIRIIAVACFLWSFFTLLTGFATSFALLAIARIGVAFGEAGGIAPSLSVMSDYFPPERRVLAVSLFTSATPVGLMLGVIGGGLIASAYDWRMAFYIAGGAGLVLAPLLYWLAPEPPRGNFEARPRGAAMPFMAVVKLFIASPTLRWMALASGLFAISANALITWMPALLMRGYDASPQEVALYYGPVVGVSLMVGLFASGGIIARLVGRSTRAYAVVPAIATLICAPLTGLALMSDSWQMVLVWSAIPMALLNFPVPPALTVVQNLAPPEARSTASALLLLVLNLIGIGLGPLLVGAISDILVETQGDDSLRLAMIATMVPIMVLTAGALYMASRTIAAEHAAFARAK
ncbi:MFS transporter [Novosphingobium sp.]|uniref:spinster family MFS transporter n=1 Tax=Novosphingobium sp. TaxID=1874826 RepID=UPI00273336F2|nr:MFS transporter [Novosphingobium sp.]MDP3908587.1 MFS transporter [Novosphingobium sp.]